MHLVWVSALKDLRGFRRDPFSVLTWIGIPLVIAGLISMVFGGRQVTPQGRLLIADEDKSIASNLLASAFSREPLSSMVLVEQVDAATGRARIGKGDASAFLHIPAGLQAAYLENRPFRLELLTNPAQRILPNMVNETLSIMLDAGFYLRKVADSQLRPLPGGFTNAALAQRIEEGRALATSIGRYLNPPLVQLETQVVAEKRETGDAASLFFPNMIFMGLLLTANGLARDLWDEKTSGTLRRLAMTPGSLGAFLAGRVLTVGLVYGLVSITGVAAAKWLAGAHILHVVQGAAWAAFSGTAFYTWMAMATVFAENARSANVFGNLVVFPLTMIGGCFFPFEMMPDGLANIGRHTPNGWAVVQFKEILFGSADASRIALTAAGLAAVSLVACAITLRRLRGGFLA